MRRGPIALLAGVAGFILYVVVAVRVADHVVPLHWLVQLVYFAVAGVAWVWPARALMAWAVRGRAG